MRSILATILPFLPAVTPFCHHGTTLWIRDDPPAFSYHGETGPLAWGTLAPENVACANGNNQSPINLVESTPSISLLSGAVVNVNIPDQPHGAELENLGPTLEVVMDETDSWIQFEVLNGTLKQFHFHAPSEHHINGEHFAMEMHFVFDAGSGLIVLGVPIEISTKTHPLLRSVFKHLSDVQSPGTSAETAPLHFSKLLKHVQRSQIWNYSGSLTTPPCSEVVTWLVVDKPLTVSPWLFRKVKDVMGFNARYTQNDPGMTNLLQFAVENTVG